MQVLSPNYEIRGVWGLDANNLWAVGDHGVTSKWDGTKWTDQSSGTDNALYAGWSIGANDAWAVGGSGTTLRFY